MSQTPKISVLMAVYNGEDYLTFAIESILQQSCGDFEFIILNDASTDGTSQILKNYAAQDKRIRLLENTENLGLTKSLNRGLQAAQGNYIARQDADDISLPERLEKQLRYLEAHPQAVLVSSNADIINPAGQKIGQLRRDAAPSVVKWLLKFYNHIGAHSAVMFRRGLAEYDETRRYSQDYDLWLRFSELGEVAILSDVLLHIRQHEQNISQQHSAEQLRQSRADSLRAFGGKISESELDLLLAFWLEPFPVPQNASQIHQLLRQLAENDPDIRRYIGGQWRAWLRSVSLRRQPLQKIKLAFYGIRYASN